MWLDADRSRLIQILNNLLSNESKYSPENSGLQLNVSVDVEILTVEFIDSGLGISEDDLGGECSTRSSVPAAWRPDRNKEQASDYRL